MINYYYMKAASKEILVKKEISKFSVIGSPAVKHKGASKSLSKSVKAFEVESPTKKGKDLELKIIK